MGRGRGRRGAQQGRSAAARDVDNRQAADLGLKPAFRRDQIMLWVLAIGLPVVLTLIFKLIFS